MVRLFKLLGLYLEQASEGRREVIDILARLIFETAVNARYLVTNYKTELVDSFIRYSLRHERKLRDTISARKAERGGTALPIEERMLKSLARAERMAGMSLDDVDVREKAPWGR
jgi:hypothetical protein